MQQSYHTLLSASCQQYCKRFPLDFQFDFVVKTVSKLNFIGEQVDNSTLKANWVIALGWSHAMFILVLEELLKD